MPRRAGIERTLLALLATGACAAAAPGQAEFRLQVNEAIDRGVAWLKEQQKPDGSFPCDHFSPVGTTALSTFALLKSGVLSSDPVVEKAISFLRYQPFEHTYAVSVEIAALDALGDRSLEPKLLGAAKWLEEQQREDGLWSYPVGRVDLSNTQYAVLGMWIAERHGFQAKRETWGRLLKELARRQNEDGGFGYREGDLSTGSMTTAGIALLHLSLERVEDDPRYGTAREKGWAALARAWKWLEERFTVEGNPRGDRTVVPTNQLYYLYGLERVGAIGDRRKIGEHDWYAEGARRIVRMQREEGAWRNCDATSFALLFLRRATFTGLHKAGEGAAAVGRTEPGAPQRPVAAAPFLRRWLVCGPLADPGDALLEARFSGEETVEPRAGSAFRGKSWAEARSLSDLVRFGPAGRPGDATISHAFAWLHVAQDTAVVLWLGSDDGARLFLDGKPVFTRHVHEEAKPDRSAVPLELSAGAHRLLVKVENAQGESGFYLRFAHADGSAAKEVRPSLSKSDSEDEATALAVPGLFSPRELDRLLPPLPRLAIGFDSFKDAELLAYDRVGGEPLFFPPDQPLPRAQPPSPHPGARGVLGLEPLRQQVAARVWFRAAVPEGAQRLALRACHEALGSPGRADAVLRAGVFDAEAGEIDWASEQTLGPTSAPEPGAWRTIEVPLAKWAGRTVLFVLEDAAGGAEPWDFERLYFDEISIR